MGGEQTIDRLYVKWVYDEQVNHCGVLLCRIVVDDFRGVIEIFQGLGEP